MHICDFDIRNRDGELFEGFILFLFYKKKKKVIIKNVVNLNMVSLE